MSQVSWFFGSKSSDLIFNPIDFVHDSLTVPLISISSPEAGGGKFSEPFSLSFYAQFSEEFWEEFWVPLLGIIKPLIFV